MVNADVITKATQSLLWMFCDGLAGVTIYEDTQQLHIKGKKERQNYEHCISDGTLPVQ